MHDTKTILIFEDNDNDFLFISILFKEIKSIEYKLLRAQRIEDFDRLNNGFIDLVIVDYQLPETSGLEIIKQLKDRYGNFAPFIFLTGMNNPGLYDQLQQLNVYDYFIKGELTESLLERACFYAIQRFEANEKYNQEREFSQYLIENLPYAIVEMTNDGQINRSNNEFKKLEDRLRAAQNIYEWTNFIHKLKESRDSFSFNFTVNEGFIYTRWKFISSQINDNHTFIGEDITAEVHEQENRISRNKLEALGHLAGGIAHELNNTLQPIILRNDLLRDIGKTRQDDQIIQHTQEIGTMLKHGASIIRDILDYSNSHDASPSQTDGDTYENFQTAIQMIRTSLEDTVTLQITGEDKLKEINILMRQNEMLKILSNIIRNAALSMDMNGIVDINIDSLYEDHDHFLKISIRDTGCGMEQDTIDKIFSPFFTTRAPGKGTGLGMSVTYSIINKYNGHIRVNSALGIGTTIDIIIPCEPKLLIHS